MIGKPAALAVALFIGGLLIGGLLSLPGRSSTGDAPLGAYWLTLEEIRDEIRENPDLQQPDLAELAGRLEAIDAVVLPDGVRIPVDHAFLSNLLRSDPPDTDGLLAILDRAIAYKNLRGEARFGAADLEALASILAAPVYAWPEPAAPNPLTEVWQRMMNAFARLVAGLIPGADAAAVLNTLLLAGVAVTLALILRYIYLNSIRSVIGEAEIDRAVGVPPGLTADRAIEQARVHSEAGDLREAVRYLYLAALLALEERGHIRLDRAHTNRELLTDLAPRPELAVRFRSVVETFDRVWYGFQPISSGEFRRYSEEVGALKK